MVGVLSVFVEGKKFVVGSIAAFADQMDVAYVFSPTVQNRGSLLNDGSWRMVAEFRMARISCAVPVYR